MAGHHTRWENADPATHEAFGELVEILGTQAQEIGISATTERGLASARTVQSVELATYYGPLLDRAPDLVSKQLTQRIEEGRRVAGTAYVAALNAREAYNETIEEIMRDYGAILTPAAPGTAPKGLGSTGDPVSRTQNYQITTLPTNVRTHVSPVLSLVPGAGSWQIGLCAATGSNGTATTLNLNDYVSGWAQVTQ